MLYTTKYIKWFDLHRAKYCNKFKYLKKKTNKYSRNKTENIKNINSAAYCNSRYFFSIIKSKLFTEIKRFNKLTQQHNNKKNYITITMYKID